MGVGVGKKVEAEGSYASHKSKVGVAGRTRNGRETARVANCSGSRSIRRGA